MHTCSSEGHTPGCCMPRTAGLLHEFVCLMQRRCYWLLEEDNSIVLVHYLAAKQLGAPKSSTAVEQSETQTSCSMLQHQVSLMDSMHYCCSVPYCEYKPPGLCMQHVCNINMHKTLHTLCVESRTILAAQTAACLCYMQLHIGCLQMSNRLVQVALHSSYRCPCGPKPNWADMLQGQLQRPPAVRAVPVTSPFSAAQPPPLHVASSSSDQGQQSVTHSSSAQRTLVKTRRAVSFQDSPSPCVQHRSSSARRAVSFNDSPSFQEPHSQKASIAAPRQSPPISVPSSANSNLSPSTYQESLEPSPSIYQESLEHSPSPGAGSPVLCGRPLGWGKRTSSAPVPTAGPVSPSPPPDPPPIRQTLSDTSRYLQQDSSFWPDHERQEFGSWQAGAELW